MLKAFCISDMGEAFVDKIRFSSKFEQITKLLEQADEFRRMLLTDGNFPATDYYNLTPELNRITIEGTFIELEKLFDLRSSLATIRSCVQFISRFQASKFPELHLLIEPVQIEPDIIRNIDRIMDHTGNIRDDASSDLLAIRRKLITKRASIDRQITSTLKQAKKSGWLSPDTEITIRNGRQVIPVPATHKRQIRGFIHDQSATGQTIFIEPEEVFEIHNEIRQLEGEEQREIIRILTEFAEFVRPFIPVLSDGYRFLGIMDFIRAKAKFSMQINAVKPDLSALPIISWNNAFHPLLYLSHQKQKKSVVPLNVLLNSEQRILVISGPNAGGKSVCLKTIGLLQFMLQCGLLIPAGSDSISGVFTDMFIDIGDEQSLENDLSTYSSHLSNLNQFVLNTNSSSLFLIDEFGAGTEPQLGGAIARAVLERLNEKKAFGVVTTHYSNLKLMARSESGIVNGAMLFDTQKMQPLFQLSIGKPGSSFAIEIARQIGFPKQILKNAEKLVGKKQLDFDEQLQQLEIEKNKLAHEQQKITETDDHLKRLVMKYDKLLSDIESRKSEIMAKARAEALEMIESSNRLIEKTVREIRESQADREKTKQLRETIQAKGKKIKEEISKTKPANNKDISTARSDPENSSASVSDGEPDEQIKIGDTVKYAEQDVTGEVLDITGEEAVIGLNSIRFKTRLEKLVKANRQGKTSARAFRQSANKSIVHDLNDKLANFNLQLDVRGKRGEEALDLVSRYIDDALLLNVKEIRILHGKGFGILRTLIHDFLKNSPDIRTFQDEHIERGGHGITVVILK